MFGMTATFTVILLIQKGSLLIFLETELTDLALKIKSSLKSAQRQSAVIRPKEKYALFPVTSPKILGSVGRQTFFCKTFLYGKVKKSFKKSLKIVFHIPKYFKKVKYSPKY